MKKFYTYIKNASLALLIASTFGCGKQQENKVVYINEVSIGEENNLIKSQEEQNREELGKKIF